MSLQIAPLDFLAEVIRDAGRPLSVVVLARRWLAHTLASTETPYTPGSTYFPGDVLRFAAERAEVVAVQDARNAKQGDFQVLTLHRADGSERRVAAGVPGAPIAAPVEVSTADVERAWEREGAPLQVTLREALCTDPRFVTCAPMQEDLWCLAALLPTVTPAEHQSILKALPETLHQGTPVTRTTEALVALLWSLQDDGSADYALLAFALVLHLQEDARLIFDGYTWMAQAAWRAFTKRPALTSPRKASWVVAPAGVAIAPDVDLPAMDEEETPEGEPLDVADTPETDDLESWRTQRLQQAVLTLHARHYYEGWLPLRGRVRRLFPPGDQPQQVTIAHHLGDERETFTCWVDQARARLWLSSEMYDTFRQYRIYPGARLRLTAISEREYEISTRPPTTSDPIKVWRMWRDTAGQIQHEEDEEPRLYDIEDAVFIADARFEDVDALFQQAEVSGNSIFGLMYAEAVCRWEAGGRRDLIVTVDDLYPAIHASPKGRMTSRATVVVELWQRLAFKPLGGGRYLFQPQFEVRRRGKDVRTVSVPLVAPEPVVDAVDDALEAVTVAPSVSVELPGDEPEAAVESVELDINEALSHEPLPVPPPQAEEPAVKAPSPEPVAAPPLPASPSQVAELALEGTSPDPVAMLNDLRKGFNLKEMHMKPADASKDGQARFQQRIRATYDELTPGFKALADFILHNTIETAFLTATELSQEVGVDPATVVRFCQGIGYSGYRELSHEIKDLVLSQVTATRRAVREADSTESIANCLAMILEQELQFFVITDLTDFAFAVDILRAARHIWITGEHMSYDIAAFLEKAFAIIGVSSTCFSPDKGTTASVLTQMQSDDVLLALISLDPGSGAGYAIRYARKKGLRTIAFSGSGIALASREAEISVTIPIRNVEGLPSFSFLFLAMGLLWETLAHQQREQSLLTLVDYRQHLQSLL